MKIVRVSLREVAKYVKRQSPIEPTKRYTQVGVRLWGTGAYRRETIFGTETQYRTFTDLMLNDIIVNKIWARNGSVSVVDKDTHGCSASPEYPIYEIDQTKLYPRYFYWFTKSPVLWDQCDLLSKGTSGQNRLKPEEFLNVEIPLPPLDHQVSISNSLDRIQASLSERQEQIDAIERETRAMLLNAFHDMVDGADQRPLSEVAPLNRRPVEVEPDVEYPELGARSFGRGLFHKPALLGSSITWQKLFRIHEGDLVFSNIKAWEGAFGVAGKADHMRVGSHRYLTCTPDTRLVTSNFLLFYLQTAEGLQRIGKASPGSADRNRTLGQKRLEAIKVPVAPLTAQRKFDQLCRQVNAIRDVRLETGREIDALIPAMLHQLFEKRFVSQTKTPSHSNSNVVSFPSAPRNEVDSPFKEAVLVGAIVNAFASDRMKPLGNFRLQKAVYFARRHMGETALDQEFLRKAAGPYNPSMRYSGGIKIAEEKNWIARRKTSSSEGSILGASAGEMTEWIKKYDYSSVAAWVRDKFKYRKNDQWEILATVDYAKLVLEAGGAIPTSSRILLYIECDPEWQPKIEKLKLTEARIQNALTELQSLFFDGD